MEASDWAKKEARIKNYLLTVPNGDQLLKEYPKTLEKSSEIEEKKDDSTRTNNPQHAEPLPVINASDVESREAVWAIKDFLLQGGLTTIQGLPNFLISFRFR